MESSELIAKVKQALAETDSRISFHLLESGVRLEYGWWQIPIFAEDRHGMRLPREFVISTLANVEDRLKASDDLNVLFIPYIPETSATSEQAA